MKTDGEYELKKQLDHHRIALFVIVLFLVLVTISILSLSVQINAQGIMQTP